VQPGLSLSARDRRFGRPSALSGQAQLAFVEAGFELARQGGLPLVTGPVSKEAIARSGLPRARKFRGHTEWLESLDGAPYSVMCFASPKLLTSLVTTHVPLARVSRMLSPERVSRAIVELADLVLRIQVGRARPEIAVCSFNPHAGEGELLGTEETRAILPGIERSRRILGRRARILGPMGAETAYRKGASGAFQGVVGIYHDQATIPMKVLDFGGAVNVTQGLSVIRTSVDHGTAYDIAGRGAADVRGMASAIELARKLAQSRRRISQGSH
jgi:4-hydroxythreonine-4-phosphate dehydrogenase